MMKLSYGLNTKRRVLTSVSAVALAAAVSTAAIAQEQLAQAQPAAADGASLDEIVVTGSRVVRDGYEAPTPVSVLGAAELQNMATANIADAVNRLPALANSLSTRGTSSTADMTGGINNLNLRGINPTRTLVLIDGKRVVGSTLAGFNNNNGAVDVNTVPTGLVSRVDIVTGGASAAYGSDALAGIVNFVFDKEFTGIKGDIQGGITTYGDNENYKVSLTAGVPFAGGRGHLLVYGENGFENGARRENRPHSDRTLAIVQNPAWGTLAGQSLTVPQYITATDVSMANATYGGLIVNCATPTTAGAQAYNLTDRQCPLRGTQFLDGGAPAPYRFGTLTGLNATQTAAGQLMIGGDQTNRIDRISPLVTQLTRANAYVRASYDLADNVNVFAEWGWAYTLNRSETSVPQFQFGLTIAQDNAFVPTSVRNQMVALGITNFSLGTTAFGTPGNPGMHGFGNKNERIQRRYVAGLEGNFDAMDTNWTWDAYYQRSTTHASVRTPDNVLSGPGSNIFRSAVDAVVNPANGQVVCRVNIDASALNDLPGCVPFNVMGVGVNSQAAIDYVTGTGYALIYLQQDVMAASASGEPFSSWAGPVSLAFGAEHRIEQVGGLASDRDINRWWFAGNFTASTGKYKVTEGFVETVIPLAAGESWAQKLDLNGAVRATDYSTSGYVTTWKIGATWTPVDDITFRATRSRDIRAPNLGDLYLAGRSGTGVVIDRTNGQQTSIVTRQGGNPNLLPEKANTTGLGVVLQPSFLPGFGASADFFNIDISGAIVTVAQQTIVDRCQLENVTQLCSLIERNPQTGLITGVSTLPANVASQSARGFDFEASYRMPLADFNENWGGNLTLRALATLYTKLETVDGSNILRGEGVNAGGAGGLAATNGIFAPDIKYLLSVGYTSETGFSTTISARGFTGGVYNNSFVYCTSGCPASTANNPTVGFENKTPGDFDVDIALNQKLMGDAIEVFFAVDNVFNSDPALIAATFNNGFYQGLANSNYDQVGRSFRLGTRFHF
jgi:outer membrane receptor protein involved in Fe transport